MCTGLSYSHCVNVTLEASGGSLLAAMAESSERTQPAGVKFGKGDNLLGGTLF